MKKLLHTALFTTFCALLVPISSQGDVLEDEIYSTENDTISLYDETDPTGDYVNGGNPDGNEPSDDYVDAPNLPDGEEHDHEAVGGAPVFYLGSQELEELTGEAGLVEGNYAVLEVVEWDETTRNEIVYFELERVEEAGVGEWDFVETEPEVYEVFDYTSEESLKEYFATHNLETLGEISEYDDPNSPGHEYDGEHETDPNGDYVDGGNSDGYEPVDNYVDDPNLPDGEEHDHEAVGGAPVFYLGSQELEELTGEAGLVEGNYAVLEVVEWDETTRNEIVYFELERVEEAGVGEWDFVETEPEVYEVFDYTSEESLKEYFASHNLETLGEISEYDDPNSPGHEYDGEHETDPNGDYVDGGNSDGYEPVYDYVDDPNLPDGEEHDHEAVGGAPVFYLGSQELEELTGEAGLVEGNYAVQEVVEWDETTRNEIVYFELERVEEVGDGEWDFVETEPEVYEIFDYTSEESLKEYFATHNLETLGEISEYDDSSSPSHEYDGEHETDPNGDYHDGAPIYRLTDSQVSHLSGWVWSEIEEEAPELLLKQELENYYAIVPNPFVQEPDSENLFVVSLHTHSLLPVVQDANGNWVEELHDFDGIGSQYGPEYIESEFGLSPVGYLHEDEPQYNLVEKIFVSGGFFDYPHYFFQDIYGTQLDMEKFVFQPETTYRFVDDGISPFHPFTLGASIKDSGIIKLWERLSFDPNGLEPITIEEHEFNGSAEDFSILSANLLMPPIDAGPNLEDFILNSNGDYFDFEYSEDEKETLAENDVKIYYICDIHDSMNGRLNLSIPKDEIEQYPVFWFSQSIFEDITGYTWASTPIYNEEGGYFAIMDVDTPPGAEMVYFSELILVSELVPEGEAGVWLAMDSQTYFTHDFIDSFTLEVEHNLSIEGYYQPPTSEENEPKGAPIYRLTDSQVSHLSGWLWSKIEEEAPELLLRQELENYYAIVPNPEFVQEPDSENLIVVSLYSHSLLPVVQGTNGNWVEALHDFEGIGIQYGPVYVETEFGLSPVGYLQELGLLTHVFLFEDGPVFYLSTVELEALTGVVGLPEGNYAVEKYMDWDEEAQEDISGYFIEPVEQSESGDWEYAGGDEEDGYEIVGFSSEESLKGYFETNNLFQSGEIYDDYYDDNGSDDGEYPGDGYNPDDGYAGDHNETDGYFPGEEYSLEEALAEFDAEVYLELNPDLANAFGQDYEAARAHFESFGYNEGRHYQYYEYDGEYPGDGYEDHNDSHGGAPVFYLSMVELEDLTGVAGLPEGNYAVEKYMDWDEESQEEIFGYFIEPVQPSESGDWEYAGGDEEDGYEIAGFSSEESLKGYFESNNLVQSGEIYDDHSDEYDDNGSHDGDYPEDGYEPDDDHEFTSLEEVEEFVNDLKNSIEELTYSDAVWVEKKHDALVDGRFVYEVGLNNMINLYFDQNGSYIHAAEDYMEERQFIPKSEISQSIKDLILEEVPNSEIIDFEVEFSRLNVPGNDNQIFFAVVENNQSESFEVVIRGDGERVIIVMPFDNVIPWRPVELPGLAVQYLADNYVYDDGYPMNYWEDQRPTPDGSAMELVAYLEDGREVIFDEDGTFNREFNPWYREEDAKLAFKNSRSAWGSDLAITNFSESATIGDNPAYVHIEKLDLGSAEESQQADEYFGGGNWDEMIYRISMVNNDLSEESSLSFDDLELANTVLTAGTPLKLTFTYEMGEPRYILVSGAKIKGFKRTWPEWDRPGSFTILAETVDAVSTSDGDLASTFGMVVVMGGERFYNGAIFQANVPVLDLKPSEFITPYEQVAAFSLGADVSSDVNVSAFLPRDLLEWNFGISEPHRVKAGLMDENGSLLFIDGSGADQEGAQFTGGGFTRIIHKGHEPDYQTYPQGGGDEDYKLGDHDSDEGFIDEDENAEEGAIKSRFDFNADGFGDSLLEVRFVANAFPAEVGFGDPYEDPYKDLNKDNMGSISGSVLDESGQPIPEFGLWFFQAPDGLDGPWEPAFFILDSNFSTGAYQAYLPEGDYYVEAWAYDPDTGTPYKPQVSESSLSILDASSSHTLDFALEKDFVVSHEYGQVRSSLSVFGFGSDDSLDISIELYPVEQNGSRITDYPTGWLWVEPNGEISGEAPSGRYEVVLFSYDNSVRLSGGPIFWDITANQPNEFPDLEADKAQPLVVSGVIYDADTNAGIWADIVFVDPSDEHREFWPQWEPVEFENPDSYVEGSYRVKIPAGTYKIKAMRWDGLYQSEYYTGEDGNGTTEFSDALPVLIDSDLTNNDIVFHLNGAPAAQVQVRIVDANTSDAVDFAWFAFFDAEDEYGPVVYPHVLENDGNYSLKLPGGNYKVMVEAGGYEPKFLTSDADGTYTWESADWASAASLSLAEGNTTSLPLAELNAFAQEDHERYAFEWFDEDANITFGTISGKVVTTKGNAVPKARIVAHTDDYLFWFDHFETKVDGTYELNNLPTGNWIVFAEPPFESEEYLGYQSSLPNWDSPIAVDANSTTDIKLTLQGSNVSGRIMYPKKNEDTGRVSLVGLQHAFLWVFQDENETGEPNYNHVEGEAFVFNEAYGETNEDGFFALSLPEAGKYSMRIELPGNLANLALAPVHFELKNPAKEMRLGNAIRIDWSKAEARATTYKLERKLSSASVYTTLDDNISGSVKSYVDYTVVPGATYDYKLTAVTTNGSKAIGDSSYKVSKPFIYLAPPSKTISGQVRDDLNATISGAEVVAWRMDGEGWANTFTDTSGSYELSVGPGKWEVTVYRPWDQNVNWSYEKAPKTVTFANTSSKTTKTVNFSVNRMGDGKVVGTIDIPDGITDAASSIWIDVFSPDGIGNWANPESNGSFSIPLKPGQYELSVWLDPDKFKGYGSPEPQFIRIGKTEVSVGTISLREFNSTISGVIATSSGSALGNAEVWAWSETGGWTSDVTDTTGAFELKVAPGRWEVGFNPPIPADGSESPYLLEPPKKVKVGDGVKTLNFTVRKAASKVEGVVYGPSGAPVADLNAWVYAREADEGDNSEEFFEVLAEVPLSPRGTFSFPGLPGTYSVGLWIPPGNDFAQPDEQVLTLSDDGLLTDEDGNSIDKIEFTLVKVNSFVRGSLVDKDTNQSISGLIGEVYAMRTDGDGWQSSPVETNGTYSILIPPGNWVMDYYLEYDDLDRNYPKHATMPVDVMIQQGEIVTQNFTLSSATASISGNVVYDETDANVTDSTLYVWAYREQAGSLPEYWNEVETDESGAFSISVLQGGNYEVGVILSNDLRENGYLEPVTRNIKMTNSTKSGVDFRLAQPPQENYLSGVVLDDSSNPLPGAFVYAWTFDGRESSTFADPDGEFNMSVPGGVIWRLGAEYSEFDSEDNEILFLTTFEKEGDLRNNDFESNISIVLKRPGFIVPGGVSITFDPNKDFTTTLPDGTELTIPGGASNVPSGVEEVRIVVTPTAKGLAKSGSEKPANYGYSIDLFDDKGKKVEGNFKKDVILSIPIDTDAAKASGLDIDNFSGMYFSSTKNAWEKAKTSTWNKDSEKLVLTTDHFSLYAGVAPPEMSDLAKDANSSLIDNENGDWYDSSWFGTFFDAQDGWIYHLDLEWVYVTSDASDEGVENYWFYSPNIGWMWTGPELFKQNDSAVSFLYSFELASWLYLDSTRGYFNYSSNSWVE